jgi:hypothetical protein
MFEHRSAPLLPQREFLGRLGLAVLLAAALLLVSLGVGVVGYHVTDGLGWLDALLNASMILTGMGPVAEMRTTAAKLFASAYALFSGVVFLTAMALIFAPVFHRFLHKFHLGVEDGAS